ncbi:hypothetical protein QRX60_30545 [Amycolatopsis mongoliensis]|uniref:Uncharacterized protein n=1 Tax=Amycolatopsis mongoliensis TaxID=715475 RepID=A0A9Y2NAA2_9PSEU|nr:hypothetical protein [Amycolatopsis sp. 4-36]WIX98395.1 hypothetical protein QRX60_30545 [Amycolatopsis sp. 4-36]
MLRPPAGTAKPRTVVLAALTQVLTAVPFLLSIIVVRAVGAEAQAAAEAELSRQGLPPSLLAGHGVSFGSDTAETPLPGAIIVVLVALALLNLAGRRAGQVLSWVFHPLLAVAGALIVPAQLFTATFLAASFRDSGDPLLQRVDVPRLVDAARQAFPGWLPVVDGAKLVFTTAGSVLVIVLLVLPSAREYFRRR